MSAIDQITQAVASSDKIDPATKSILTEFLQSAGPVLSNVAGESLQDLLSALAGGNSSAAVDIVSNSLTPQQVVVLLDAAQEKMNTVVNVPTTSVSAAQSAMAALENAALSLVVRAIISAL